jgi:hypothetical protein
VSDFDAVIVDSSIDPVDLTQLEVTGVEIIAAQVPAHSKS